MAAPGIMIHPTHAVIDRKAFGHNLGIVRTLIGPDVRIMAVMKSNGYGHGVSVLAGEAISFGADYLAVARVDEGLELRTAGISAPILVFEIAAEGQIESALEQNLDLTITSLDGARALNGLAEQTGRTVRAHVKVDTGMGRLGILPGSAAGIVEKIARLPKVEIISVWSHFATADHNDKTYAKRQLELYREIIEEIEKKGIAVPLKHMANTAALLSIPESHFDMVRPGIMMFGLTPSRELAKGIGLQPVMSLVSAVAYLKEVGPGVGISYGVTYKTMEKTRIATIPIGYADGYPRDLSNRSFVLIRGKRYPVVGAVSMDHLMVNVGLQEPIKEGDAVTMFGKDGQETLTCWDLAELHNTIPYEIMCAVSARVPRIVVG